MNCSRLLYLYVLAVFGAVVAQLGLGGLYGNPYAMGGGYGMGMPGIGMGMGMGTGLGYPLMNNYGYGSYDYRCRNLLGLGYNPLYGGMLGR